jgi:hypothetical protein
MLIPRRGRADKESAPREQEATGTSPQPGDTDVARRVLAHAASPEEKLEQLLATRTHELEEQAHRFEQAMTDLERREELLRDMRASVERLLRLGTNDLTEREVELQELGREFLEREARLSAAEAEVNRRRSELGAVELKREALEQRERALAVREEELATTSVLDTSEQLAGSGVEPDRPDTQAAGRALGPITLLFVPGPAYTLVEVEHRSLEVGALLEHGGDGYVVAHIGRAPLPGDPRTCAYLERDAPGSVPGSSASEGSS